MVERAWSCEWKKIVKLEQMHKWLNVEGRMLVLVSSNLMREATRTKKQRHHAQLIGMDGHKSLAQWVWCMGRCVGSLGATE